MREWQYFGVVGVIAVGLMSGLWAAAKIWYATPQYNSQFLTDLNAHIRTELPYALDKVPSSVVVSGGTASISPTLTHTIGAVEAWVAGYYVQQADTLVTHVASRRGYVYLSDSDTGMPSVSGGNGCTFGQRLTRIIVVSCASGSSEPAVRGVNAVLLFSADTDTTAITTVALHANPYAVRPSEVGLFVNVREYGAKADGITDDTSAIQATIDRVFAAKGGIVWFPHGRYRIRAPLVWPSGVHLAGPGFHGADRGNYPAEIVSAASDLITSVGARVRSGQKISGLKLTSEPGGGHIFVHPVLSRAEYYNLLLDQQNTDKAILYSVGTQASDEGYFGNWWHHFEARYRIGNTLPAFYIKNSTINQLVFEHARIGRNAIKADGTFAFWIESVHTGSPAIGNRISQITFQQPGGGAIRFRSVSFSRISEVGIYDMTFVPVNPTIIIDSSPIGNQPSQANVIETSWINVGDTTNPDVRVDTTTLGGGTVTIIGGKIGILDGNDTTGQQNKVALIGALVNTRQNIGTLEIINNQVAFKHTNGLITNFDLRRGNPGAFDGYFQFYINGSYAASFNSYGEFRVGGTQTSPNARITSAGRLVGTEFQIGGGAVVNGHLSNTKTWHPPSLANGAQTTTTIIVPGSSMGDTVLPAFSQDLQGMQLTGSVSAPDTVTVVLRNGAGSTINLAPGTLRADVWKH